MLLETLTLALNGVFVTLLALVGGSLVIRERAERPWTVAVLALAAALVITFVVRVPAREIPLGWITVLSEGTGKRNVWLFRR